MEFQRQFYKMAGQKQEFEDIITTAVSYPFTTRIDDLHVNILWLFDREYKKLPPSAVKELLALSSMDIFREISAFVLIIDTYKSDHSLTGYSDQLSENILEQLHGQNYAFPRDRLNAAMSRDGFLRKNANKTLGGSLLKIKKYTKGRHVYRGNVNKLSAQVDAGRFDSILPILHFIKKERDSETISQDAIGFIKYLSELLVNEVESFYGELSDRLIKYLEDMIFRRWSETWEDMNFPFHKYINVKKGCFLSGTSGHYYDRLISYAFYRHGLKVVRFGHGGDRGLFDDFSWEVMDLAFANVYVAHGQGESEVLATRTSRHQLPSISNESVKFIDFGSDYHRSIFETSLNKTPRQTNKKPRKNVVIGAPAFSGIIRAMPYIKPHDFVCLDVQIKILDIVNKLGYNAILKRHPKAKLTKEAVYGPFGAHEVFGQKFIEATAMSDAYVFSVAGSAFIEALCTMKPVILLNIPYRPFNKDVFNILRGCCEIVDVELDDHGRVHINAQTLSSAIESIVDVNKRSDFLHDYLLNGRFDRDDFNELV